MTIPGIIGMTYLVNLEKKTGIEYAIPMIIPHNNKKLSFSFLRLIMNIKPISKKMRKTICVFAKK